MGRYVALPAIPRGSVCHRLGFGRRAGRGAELTSLRGTENRLENFLRQIP